MGESNQYVAVELDQVFDVLQGRDRSMDSALRVLTDAVRLAPARDALMRLRGGETVAWDGPGLREEPWETFAELSSFIGSSFRLFGRPVGFDAWPDRLRVQFALSDWRPLPRAFGRTLACRPVPGIELLGWRDDQPATWSAFVESYPHSWLRQAEFPEVLPGLHAVINDLCEQLGDDDSDPPLATVAPGRGIDSARIIDVLSLDDGSDIGWQLARALPLYEALCKASELGTDLAIVGY